MLFLCLRDWPWAPLYVFCCDKLFMQVVVIVLLYVSDVLVVTACMWLLRGLLFGVIVCVILLLFGLIGWLFMH